MTVDEKKAVLLVEIPWLTLELCAKLTSVLKIKSLYGLLRTNREMLEEDEEEDEKVKGKEFNQNELYLIHSVLYRLGFTFLPSNKTIVTGLAIRWEQYNTQTPVNDVFPPDVADELRNKGVSTLGDLYQVKFESEARKVVVRTANLSRVDRILRSYHAQTVQPWIDFPTFWDKVRVRFSDSVTPDK